MSEFDNLLTKAAIEGRGPMTPTTRPALTTPCTDDDHCWKSQGHAGEHGYPEGIGPGKPTRPDCVCGHGPDSHGSDWDPDCTGSPTCVCGGYDTTRPALTEPCPDGKDWCHDGYRCDGCIKRGLTALTEPATKAGRALMSFLDSASMEDMGWHGFEADILAIEAEAVQREREALVERVAEGLDRYWVLAGALTRPDYRAEARRLLGLDA